MSDNRRPLKIFKAINKNKEIRSLLSLGDKISDAITAVAGSVPFFTGKHFGLCVLALN